MIQTSRVTTTDIDPEHKFVDITETQIQAAWQAKLKGSDAVVDAHVTRFLHCLTSPGGRVDGTDQERLKWR
jgi:hypothetical protein